MSGRRNDRSDQMESYAQGTKGEGYSLGDIRRGLGIRIRMHNQCE